MVLIFAPNFNSFSLTHKYQSLLASASSYTLFLNIHPLLVLAYLGGHKYIILSIFIPCKNAVFTSIKLIFWFCEVISANIDLVCIGEQHGVSVGKPCNSSNPLAHSLTLVYILFPSTIFLLVTHLTDIQGCSESSSSK